MNNEDLLAAALSYHEKGFSVIPVRPQNKAPIPSGWQRYSTTRSTKEEIEQWWKDVPNANIGIALGPANGTDGRYLFVVDQDVLKDKDHVPVLNDDGTFKQKGDIQGCPTTLSQTTGSGGKQLFYWAPLGYHVGNPKPRPLIDIKGFGGQVLVPPSIHPNGNKYAWDVEALSQESIAEFPQDALDALLGTRTNTASSMEPVLAGVPIGAGLRHAAIAKVAGFYLGRAQSPEEIEMARTALYAWDKEKNRSPEPWPERKRELDSTFDGILSKEMSKPSRSLKEQYPSKLRSSQPMYSSFADIQTMPLQWLWQGRIALGKLSLIVGDPSVGKSLLTAAMASIVSKGYVWPVDDIASPIGDVILLSAEDDPADTTKPRLEAAEADSKRVHTLQAIRELQEDGTQTQRMFSLKRDLNALEDMLATLPECKLVIVDPISAYLDDTDSHRNAAVRGLLGPLAALASKYKIAIVAIDHLNKNSNESNTDLVDRLRLLQLHVLHI
jgi:Bifunctional DNA primase/polymerase, N-terminal/AAA domain